MGHNQHFRSRAHSCCFTAFLLHSDPVFFGVVFVVEICSSIAIERKMYASINELILTFNMLPLPRYFGFFFLYFFILRN